MIGLLDANVLIALFDAAHVHHADAQEWLAAHRAQGWATCPITQNACIRIFSQAAYPGRLSVADISRRLRLAVAATDHHFWPDTLSLADSTRFAHRHLLTPRHLTDVYLLALAVKNRGRLVTFDRSIPTAAVTGAETEHLVILGLPAGDRAR
jgi:toxin-antitoxin system PIN domain toxin